MPRNSNRKPPDARGSIDMLCRGEPMSSKWYWLIAIVILAPIVLMYILSLSAGRPTNLGVKDGKLAPCPSSPNCVSTQADDEGHKIEPITYTGSKADALAKLKQAIATLPRTHV